MSRSVLRSVLSALADALLIAGCGGGDDESSGSTDIPEQKQPVTAQVPVFERAAADLNCKDAVQVVHPTLLSEPDKPASKANCGDALYALREVQDFKAVDAAEFGTAAVMDGTADGKPVALIWALDDQGSFKWIGGFSTESQFGTKLAADVNHRHHAEAFVEALRNDDCKAAFEAMEPKTRLAYNDPKQFCSVFKETFTASPEGLGSRLMKDPGAELVDLGGTKSFAFFALATDPAGYRTIVVSGSEKGQPPKVFDVVPAER